jgi:hypothetical protein
MKLRQQLGRIHIQLRGKNKIVGWGMTPDKAQTFFKSMGKKVVTFFGYSSIYENEKEMLTILKKALSEYSPETTLINFGVTQGGLGGIYSIAKSMGFITAGVVCSLALEYPTNISRDVDYICFIKDTQWGGKLPRSNQLCPTSQAMVLCSDILIGIGGGKICRDEMLFGQELGKPIHFYPAEVNHEWWISRTKKMGFPHPESFWGATHEVFGKKDNRPLA